MTSQIKNLKEFEQLILRYESITLEEIENLSKKCGLLFNEIPNELTGFGRSLTCTLCIEVSDCYKECIYYIASNGETCCYDGLDYIENSYRMIENAKNSKQLLKAFKYRAKCMRRFARANKINLTI